MTRLQVVSEDTDMPITEQIQIMEYSVEEDSPGEPGIFLKAPNFGNLKPQMQPKKSHGTETLEKTERWVKHRFLDKMKGMETPLATEDEELSCFGERIEEIPEERRWSQGRISWTRISERMVTFADDFGCCEAGEKACRVPMILTHTFIVIGFFVHVSFDFAFEKTFGYWYTLEYLGLTIIFFAITFLRGIMYREYWGYRLKLVDALDEFQVFGWHEDEFETFFQRSGQQTLVQWTQTVIAWGPIVSILYLVTVTILFCQSWDQCDHTFFTEEQCESRSYRLFSRLQGLTGFVTFLLVYIQGYALFLMVNHLLIGVQIFVYSLKSFIRLFAAQTEPYYHIGGIPQRKRLYQDTYRQFLNRKLLEIYRPKTLSDIAHYHDMIFMWLRSVPKKIWFEETITFGLIASFSLAVLHLAKGFFIKFEWKSYLTVLICFLLMSWMIWRIARLNDFTFTITELYSLYSFDLFLRDGVLRKIQAARVGLNAGLTMTDILNVKEESLTKDSCYQRRRPSEDKLGLLDSELFLSDEASRLLITQNKIGHLRNMELGLRVHGFVLRRHHLTRFLILSSATVGGVLARHTSTIVE